LEGAETKGAYDNCTMIVCIMCWNSTVSNHN